MFLGLFHRWNVFDALVERVKLRRNIRLFIGFYVLGK
jgi:hypothetical protein